MAKEIKMLSLDELEQMNEKELKAEVARLKARIRSRRSALKKAGLDQFADAENLSMDVGLKTYNDSLIDARKRGLIAEIRELQAQLNNPSFTVKGAKRRYKEYYGGRYGEATKNVERNEQGKIKGGSANERYGAIMDLVSPSDRKYIRDQDSQDVFQYTEIILKQGLHQGLITKEDFDRAVSDYANSAEIRDGNIF